MTTPEQLDAVRRVLDNRGWKLVTDLESFAQSVYDEVLSKPDRVSGECSEKEVKNATIHQYCFILFDACGEAGSPRQGRAYEELWAHLNGVALYKRQHPGMAEEYAQQSLLNIFRSLSSCTDPGCFLGWCDSIILNLIRDDFRRRMRKTEADGTTVWEPIEVTETDLARDEDTLDEDFQPAISPDESEEWKGAWRTLLREQLIQAVRACLSNKVQQEVIIQLFLNNKSFLEVAERLGTTVNNVRVQKTRAKKLLRRCEKFTRLYEEWLK